MNRNLWLTGVLAVAGLASGCQHVAAQPGGWRRVAVDSGAQLVVQLEGGRAGLIPTDETTPGKTGETVHRMLRGDDGSVLFAYDVVLKKTAKKKEYQLLLSPVASGAPTFSGKRTVLAKADEDLVRVELMQQPETLEKLVDVYKLMAVTELNLDLHNMSLMEMHNALFRWVHGK